MPQIAIVQTAPAQPQTVNQTSPQESQAFAPHLEKAVEKNNTSNTSTESQKQKDTASADVHADAKSPAPDNTATDKLTGSFEDSVSSEDLPAESAQATAMSLVIQKGTATAAEVKTDNNFFASLASKLLAIQTSGEEPDAELAQLIRSTLETTPKGQIMAAVASASGQQSEKSGPTPALLAQLQKIIENSSETGTVTINRENQGYAHRIMNSNYSVINPATPLHQENQIMVSMQEGRVPGDGLLAVNVDGMNRFAEKTGEQITPQRHSTQQQYYDAKLSIRNDNDNSGQETQQQTAGNDTTAQFGTSSTLGSGGTASESSGVFSVPANSTAQPVTSPVSDPARPAITLPSGTTVAEEEVFKQITERFQVSRRTADTRINIKLHPAELGELKIDLTVKDGSIRAHVIAQSQQVQDIIERNMAKLKSSLENQGFTVDEISVAAQSDSVGDFDLFDGQLAQQSDFMNGQTKTHKSAANFFQADELAEIPLSGDTGVNLTI